MRILSKLFNLVLKLLALFNLVLKLLAQRVGPGWASA
jgi:hypothetical protein